MNRILFVLIVAACMCSCSEDNPQTASEYYHWLNSEEHGFVKKQRINGVELTVKVLPQDLLVAKELNGSQDQQLKDSLRNAYRNTLTMVMTFAPDENKEAKGDIVFKGVENKQGYTERMLTMNFGLQDQVKLNAGGKERHPVLSGLENTYGLESSRSIVLAFPLADAERETILQSDWTLTYDDVLFDMGIVHFHFDHEQLNQLPGFPEL